MSATGASVSSLPVLFGVAATRRNPSNATRIPASAPRVRLRYCCGCPEIQLGWLDVTFHDAVARRPPALSARTVALLRCCDCVQQSLLPNVFAVLSEPRSWRALARAHSVPASGRVMLHRLGETHTCVGTPGLPARLAGRRADKDRRMSVLHADGLLAEWSHNGVTDFASRLVSFSCGRDCLLGKTLQHRVLSVTEFPEHHRSARRSPSFRQTVANGVTTESHASLVAPSSSRSASAGKPLS